MTLTRDHTTGRWILTDTAGHQLATYDSFRDADHAFAIRYSITTH